MLKGQAKTDYQREYMRKRRAGLTVRPTKSVRPIIKNSLCGPTEIPEQYEVIPGVPTAVIPKLFKGELTKDRQTSQKGFND